MTMSEEMKRLKKNLERIKEEHVQALITFLSNPRTYDEIKENVDFNFLVTILHCSEESIKKSIGHFNWISTQGVPETAVRKWISDGGLPRKSQ